MNAPCVAFVDYLCLESIIEAFVKLTAQTVERRKVVTLGQPFDHCLTKNAVGIKPDVIRAFLA